MLTVCQRDQDLTSLDVLMLGYLSAGLVGSDVLIVLRIS